MAKSTVKKSVKPAAKIQAKPVAKKPVVKPVAVSAKKSVAAKKPSNQVSKSMSTATAKKTESVKPAPKAVVAAPKPKRTYKPVKLPADYKPSAKEEYMSPMQEEYFRQKLLAWRKSLMDESRETLDHLHEENWHQADIADRASLETEAGVELRTRNRYLKLISKIDAAIRRIEDGEYGYCEETGEPIGLKRLEARPVATLSIEAQERHEKMERQYIDED